MGEARCFSLTIGVLPIVSRAKLPDRVAAVMIGDARVVVHLGTLGILVWDHMVTKIWKRQDGFYCVVLDPSRFPVGSHSLEDNDVTFMWMDDLV